MGFLMRDGNFGFLLLISAGWFLVLTVFVLIELFKGGNSRLNLVICVGVLEFVGLDELDA